MISCRRSLDYARDDKVGALEMTKEEKKISKIRIIRSKNKKNMTKKETIKFIVQLIASIASAILTALGATSCVGA